MFYTIHYGILLMILFHPVYGSPDSKVNSTRLEEDVGSNFSPLILGELTESSCDAHEFLCKNKNCINKIYICDGEDDCYDNSDEENCGPVPAGARCPPTHFDCGSSDSVISDFECIFRSFRCDGQSDCAGGIDEVNCTRPKITESTTSPIDISVGETVHCICAVSGEPPPVISWRFNEKRIPSTSRLTVQSLNGKSQLTLTNATKALSGSYQCEAHNTKGSVRAYPKCVINVKVPGDACKPPRYNAAALSPDECRECFCMGVTGQCQSASLYKEQIVTKFVNAGDSEGFRLVSENGEEINPRRYRVDVDNGVLRITNVTETGHFYWKLPQKYLGQRFTSYGGVLQFYLKRSSTVIHSKQQRDIFNQSQGRTPADVIVQGNGMILEYRHILEPRPDVYNHLITPLVEEVWKTRDGKLAGREDLMRVLFNLSAILIRVGGGKYQSISFKDVSLDVAVANDTGQGRAVYVEQCRCPQGYQGLSCQSCVEGYIRDPGVESFPTRCITCACHGHSSQCHPNNGTCFNCAHNTEGPFCEKCQAGFYGNARRGTPTDCLPCPCPRDRPPNRFSKTCFLAKDGRPTCDACEKEYTGRNCERCNKNYTGNPLAGEKCLPSGPESCDIRGSYSDKPDRETRKCRCKPYVTGVTCNACRPGFFGLGLDPYGGCLKCFCNGVSDECASSVRNKTQITVAFRVGGSQGVTLTNANETLEEESFLYNSVTQELIHKVNRDKIPLFWKLPETFTGNKLASYGGILSFVSSYDSSKKGKTVTVLLKGSGIILKNSQAVGLRQQEYTFVLKEGQWRSLVDESVSRTQLLMVLSSLDAILIEALFDTKTLHASLREVSLDIAVDRPTNQSRALRVEKCACPKGYVGLSCESCDKGYYETPDGRYLGRCVRCSCNRHSEECDVSDGTCQNCLHNTFGDHCEKCKPGYYGDSTIGSIYDCRPCACPMTKPPNRFSQTCFVDLDGFPTCDACPVGYTGRKCERCIKPFVGNPLVVGDFCKFEEDCGCDPRGTVNNTCDPFTRQCFCKANVEGKRCNKCRVSFFNLDSSNPDGCMPCFCFGVTSECECARGFRDKVRLSDSYESIGQDSALRLVDRRGVTVVNTGILLVGVPPHFVYNRFDRLPRKTYYWYLPKQFLGDKISSYGGTLSFTISHDMLPGGQLTRESDVEIRGYGLVLVHKLRFPPSGGQEITHHVLIVESSFTFPHGPTVSREDLIIALSAIKSILIRATYSTTTYQASLYAVAMDITVQHDTLLEQVNTVEKCKCPTGYTGLSCQMCAPGYTRVKPGPGFSRCVRCNCNRHTLECDPETGKCLSCNDNTAGDHCEVCKDGYYGDATKGTSADCKVCRCPLDISSNSFSRTCRIDVDGYPTCTACQQGYVDRDCGRCSQGYTGNPRSPGGKCEKVPEELLPKATVWPQYRKDSEGTRTVFYCLSNGKRPLTVTWSRLDDRPLSSRAQVDSRAISIPAVRKQDEGGYVCTVKNAYGQHTARGTLNVLARPEDPITVSVTPRTLHLSAKKTARFVCKAKSPTYATLKWTKGQTGTLPPDATDKDGILTIPTARRWHTGTYTCTGSNQYSFDQISVRLRVAEVITPQVSIIPRFHTVDEGDAVEFRCSASGFPPPELTWTGGSARRLPDDVVLSKGNSIFQIPRAKKEHEGEYFCIAKNDGAVGRMRTVLNVRAVGSAPIVQLNPKQLSVTEGDIAEFKCTATGDPQPILRWTRVEGNFSQSALRVDGVLRIDPTAGEDQGTYVCTAANRFGAIADNAVLNVEKDNSIAPTASVFPEEITANEGETAEITCQISGTPLPSMEWSRVGGVLRENHVFKGSKLSIVNITGIDEGMYVCIAQNRKGVQQATAIVRVTENIMPKVEIMPAANQTVLGGDTVVFRCMVKEGEPKPSIMWMDGSEKPVNTSAAHVQDNVLMISRVSGEDEGRYVCRASNAIGTVYAEAVLTVQAQPRVSVTPSSPHVVPVGSQVTLVCSATGYPRPTVQWIAPVSNSPALRPVKVKPDSLQLVIEHVTLQHQGNYRCMADNVAGSSEAVIKIVVTPLVNKPPEVEVSPANITVLEGEKVVYQCNKSGIPTPTSTWVRVGGTLPETAVISESGQLNIESVSSDDQGVYLCTATNSEGSASAKARLMVTVPPKVSITPHQVSVTLGDSLRLYCISSPPLPLTWTKLKGTIPSSAMIDGGVMIKEKTTVNDTGKYRCQAKNEAGVTEAVAMVTIFVPPQIDVSPANYVTTLGSKATFHCRTTGIPQPVITWTKENGYLPKNHIVEGGALTIFDMKRADQGQYLCAATNAVGHSKMTATLAIEGLPDVSIVGGTSVKTIPMGGNLTLKCIGTGIPKPTIRWDRVDGELPENVKEDGGSLVIQDAQPSYGGSYRCSVSNRVGSVQSQVVLFIQDAPKVTITPEVHKVKIGETAEFNCIASGSPSPEVTWVRLNSSLPVGHQIKRGQLIITNVSRDDAGIYICRATNMEGIAESSATIKIRGTVPRFEQNPVSYMAFPTLTNDHFNFTIELFFMPEIADGLILYNDQHDSDGVGDFVSFGMSDGFAEFRFDLGSGGPAVIRSRYQLVLNDWHTVKLTRHENHGSLQINNEQIRRGSSKGKPTQLNLNQRLHVGGVANFSLIDSLAGFTKGFIGCIGYVAVDDKRIDIGKPEESVGVTDCDPCLTMPCKNTGQCLETHEAPGFVCNCRSGFTGPTCQEYGERCSPGACMNGRCVNLEDAAGFKCICPVGYTGKRCEEGTKIETPMFEGTSFMSYPAIQGALLETKLTMRFMLNEEGNMLLLYNGQQLFPNRGDFISLAVIDGKVEFRFDLGYGAAVIRSENNITTGQWHTVVAERFYRDGSMILDSEPAVKAKAPCCSVGLNLALPLYIGGLPQNITEEDTKRLGVDVGLKGCVSDLSIDDNEIDLVNSYVEMRSIVQCKACLLPCQIKPCMNNATCEPQGQTGYVCACMPGYTGKNCEITLVGPGKNRTCLNGGLPFPPTGKVCDCPIGYGGTRCESVVQIRDTISFSGDGYVQYPNSIMKRKLRRLETITLRFKSSSRNGLMFWQGQHAGIFDPFFPSNKKRLLKIGASKGDYIAIGLRKGFLEFSFDLGAGTAVLLSRRRLDDGKWHYVKIFRQSQQGALVVDNDEIVNGTSSEGARSLNSPGPIFLGGGEDIDSLTFGRFSDNYAGCLGGVYLQSRAVKLQSDATKGYNVLPCENEDDDHA